MNDLYCKICSQSISSGISLSSGSLIHELCLEKIQNEYMEITKKLYYERENLTYLVREHEKRQGFIAGIIYMLFKSKNSMHDIANEIHKTENNIKSLSFKLSLYQSVATSIFEFLLSYPPDWEERKKSVIERDGERCVKCGGLGHLHLHHMQHLSHGGTNNISNLKLYCEECHSELHGGRDFSGDFKRHDIEPQKNPLEKKILLIKRSIKEKKLLKFRYLNYEKGHEENYVQAKEIYSDGVVKFKAYCLLSKFERVFRVDKVSKLEITHSFPLNKSPADFIDEALARELMIHCQYTKSSGGRSIRTLKPEGYTSYRGVRVLRCFDYLTNEHRNFAPQRMKNIEIVNAPKEQKIISGKA